MCNRAKSTARSSCQHKCLHDLKNSAPGPNRHSSLGCFTSLSAYSYGPYGCSVGVSAPVAHAASGPSGFNNDSLVKTRATNQLPVQLCNERHPGQRRPRGRPGAGRRRVGCAGPAQHRFCHVYRDPALRPDAEPDQQQHHHHGQHRHQRLIPGKPARVPGPGRRDQAPVPMSGGYDDTGSTSTEVITWPEPSYAVHFHGFGPLPNGNAKNLAPPTATRRIRVLFPSGLVTTMRATGWPALPTATCGDAAGPEHRARAEPGSRRGVACSCSPSSRPPVPPGRTPRAQVRRRRPGAAQVRPRTDPARARASPCWPGLSQIPKIARPARGVERDRGGDRAATEYAVAETTASHRDGERHHADTADRRRMQGERAAGPQPDLDEDIGPIFRSGTLGAAACLRNETGPEDFLSVVQNGSAPGRILRIYGSQEESVSRTPCPAGARPARDDLPALAFDGARRDQPGRGVRAREAARSHCRTPPGATRRRAASDGTATRPAPPPPRPRSGPASSGARPPRAVSGRAAAAPRSARNARRTGAGRVGAAGFGRRVGQPFGHPLLAEHLLRLSLITIRWTKAFGVPGPPDLRPGRVGPRERGLGHVLGVALVAGQGVRQPDHGRPAAAA